MESIIFSNDSNVIFQALIEKANRLILLGNNLEFNNDSQEEVAWKHEEFAADSTLHRGYYHPSPIYDFVVGNTKRGRLLLRPTKRSNVTHRYLYDENDNLCIVETYSNKTLSSVERLFIRNTESVGVTFDKNDHLSTVVIASYEDKHIKELTLVNCFETEQGPACWDIHYERYYYDAVGLHECDFVTVIPNCKCVTKARYRFAREDGYLVEYTDITPDKNISPNRQVTYRPGIKRKA